MKPEYCDYPPQPAADLELAEQPDGARVVWAVGAASVGRYLLLGAVERNVLLLINGAQTPRQICDAFERGYGGKLSLATLTKFLAKLESYGLLAGTRTQAATADSPQSQLHYVRFKLFNPESLFTRLLPRLRWIWATGFFAFTVALMLIVGILALMNSAEVTAYGEATLRDHFIAIFIAAWLIGVTHEFAHGMTCKAFGGRATEVGVLMVYYFMPALYCNVSGIHLIPTRRRRMWVIAAGVYWQLLVGAVSLSAWYLLAPHTPLADAAFVILLGSVLDVLFNANPLIKLDGYYFLSQWLRLPNLMDRSRAHWRGVFGRILFGQPNAESARYTRRERAVYLIYGALSFVYNAAFASLIVAYVGGWLMDRFYLLGFVLALGVALLFLRRPLGQIVKAFVAFVSTAMSAGRRFRLTAGRQKVGGNMADNNQPTTPATTPNGDKDLTQPLWRRRLVPLSFGVLAVVILVMPWSASVGNYGTLIAIPDQETILRAPESASLVALRVRPGDQVAGGAVVGQMGNLDLEEQIVTVQADLARANAEQDRLQGELREREEAAQRAGTQLRQRQHEYDEIDSERRQIAGRQQIESREARVIAASASLNGGTFDQTRMSYPAALAVLQAEVDSARAQLDEAKTQRDRARKLNAEGLVARSELDAAEMRAATCGGTFAAANQRLEAALIEHRRKFTSTATEMNLATSDLSAERLQISKLNGELKSVRELVATLGARRDLLAQKRAQFALTSPRGGTIFGEELPRMVGQFFQKGSEICRIADTRQLLLRVSVPEREIGDVRAGASVRLKTRAFPDQTFRGVVSKIAGESETDPQGQTTYRVELTIENGEGLLRPGMTAFARIDFDRQMVARILLHKIRQTLRPELWML